LRGWYLAESDPDAALAVFASIGFMDVGYRIVIVQAAVQHTDRALSLYRSWQRDRDVLITAIGAIGDFDVARALSIIETDSWASRVHKWEALVGVVSAATKRDWQDAFHIIQPILDDSLRSMALRRIVTALPQDLTASDTILAYNRLMAEAEALAFPDARLDVYESLIETIQTKPSPLPSITASLVMEIGMGDRNIFLRLLPDLIRLACKGNPDMPFKLEVVLSDIKALLDA